ncbi:MAG TPA: hypothetical protein VHB48_03565 [Chitinophagaceae bacterium]|nr:hypothetical protein [Chitinophagaceae bacterium]
MSVSFLCQKKSPTLAKSVIAAICLLLVAPQFSSKFYQYANFLGQTAKNYNWQVSYKPAPAYGYCKVGRYNHSTAATLDKRYDVQHFFINVPPVFSLHPAIFACKQQFNVLPYLYTAALHTTSLKRGPPFYV